ncbi:PVC-type heme-binding CxxCH protein [Chitinophaga sp. 22620]|uniref:PVC-type heme-binding CxxCH protein n=1 Tax=Chitinophaga sp. 22620 TaxID=3453952 RepID=UPI003F86FCF1
MRNVLKLCTGLLLPVALFTSGGCGNKPKYPGPLSPEEALKSLHIINGLKVELFAAEPLVTDPVSMEFDEDGNCYVVVMSDYPDKPAPGTEKGHIRVLRDTDGDGRADTSIVFADKLSEGTSILPWKGGLLVTAAPEILYMKDTTGDFVADTREVLFSGFFKDNPETQITNLRFGVDNWIYANNRGQDGNVTFRDKPDAKPLSVKGADFRFRLDRGLFELETGPGQFGQAIDDYRNRFVTENSIHIQQIILPWRYTHRHAYLPSARAIRNISDHDPIMFQESATPYWRAERTRRRNAEFQEKKLKRVEYEREHFTGASGGTFYNGDALPQEFYGNIFTGEVAGNLVHRDVLVASADSVHFTAKRSAAESKQEFISSNDTWFRPVNFTTGPDGYLYVLDYYRQHIETPVSIPDDLKADMDFYEGSDKGRIYRVMPANGAYRSASPKLSKTSSDSLVQLFPHPNQWYAQQAHRLLVERQDRSVIPALKQMQGNADPRARLHALYTLEALDALDVSIVKKALADSSADVQEHAAILAENYPACLPELLALVKDSPAKLTMQAALSLGQFNNARVTDAFVQVLERFGDNKYMQMAVLSSDAGSSPAMLAALFKSNIARDTVKLSNSFIHDLSYIVGARNNSAQLTEYTALLEHGNMQAGSRQSFAAKGLLGGMEKSEGSSPALKTALKAFRPKLKNVNGQTLADLKTLVSTTK